ncbi:uncharacterized protein LOC132745193 [Ruditapes philippinarum]|uniref:uncharacterized protein LOC132745193 n=1 Tax=Ruditapes philippinarum TaxID=129788 RepID=UPI00295B405A|nr:uncharacterized protein LOC132745193 [Ruditapes philippinarum]
MAPHYYTLVNISVYPDIWTKEREEKQESDSKENDNTREASVVVTGRNAQQQSTEDTWFYNDDSYFLRKELKVSKTDNKNEKLASLGRQSVVVISDINTGKEEPAWIKKMNSTNKPILPPEFRRLQNLLTTEPSSATRHQNGPQQYIDLLSPFNDLSSVDNPLLNDDPPSYEETITILKQKKNIVEKQLEVYGEKLTNDESARLGSIERTVSQTRHVTDQTHILQRNMNDRLDRIEQHLQEKRPSLPDSNNALQMQDERFESVERTVTETRQNMIDRLERIEHSLQNLHVSITFIELKALLFDIKLIYHFTEPSSQKL